MAPQVASVPLPAPAHVQFQGPLAPHPTPDGVPEEQRLLEGLFWNVPPSALPQAPFTVVTLAEQLWLDPPFVPEQVQVHGPVPDTLPAEPAEQRLLEGFEEKSEPSALPQAPFTG